MKPTLLIIALLIGMVGSAQKPITVDTIRYKVFNDVDSIKFNGATYIKSTLTHDYVSDLLEYERKCYNDSSVVKQHHSINGELCVYDYGCIVESHYWNDTIHLTPTFEGFIEFVKTKYKQK